MSFLEVKKVNKIFVGHQALTDVSLNVPEGTIFGLLGPNGAGKTTLIRIINNITLPDSGEIFFNGEALKPKHVKNIGYLPEERGLYKKMKTGEQAMYFAQLKGMSRAESLKKLKYWFQKFGIESWWNKKVEELSKGMQQKIQFIVTILHEPKLLIFDEPFSGFDPINVNLLKKEILKLKENGSTIIFSTHNMASVEELCDNIALINNSKKVLDGNVQDIKQEFKSNVFDLHFKGNFDKFSASVSANYKIEEVRTENGLTICRTKLLNGTTTNHLISTMLPYGELVGMNEVIPSINDIFIQVVEKENKKG
ncbi:MAG: ABC transporter ATP-binding protein [Bacteroidetes bacterium 4572_117]|nr:MAG: ABC transporter ATP-binding protein [Bacteroidetes bacterium 4572_117]